MTPEEKAEEYLHNVDIPTAKCVSLPTVAGLIDDAYLAGYSAAQPQWIKCSERMPENGREVLAIGDMGHSRSQMVSAFLDRYWTWFDNNETVTHWMPLPEPPQEEK